MDEDLDEANAFPHAGRKSPLLDDAQWSKEVGITFPSSDADVQPLTNHLGNHFQTAQIQLGASV